MLAVHSETLGVNCALLKVKSFLLDFSPTACRTRWLWVSL